MDVAAGATLDLTIALSEGTGTYSETVNVAGERFREQEKSVPAQQTLGSAEIQNLRNLLTNDPMRAIQVLPGVTTGDDFRSEFAVRGSPFSRMNFTFDGIPTSFLLHTVQQVQDGGSIAMVNGDILDGITLLNGSYPQRYGNRLGAELDFHMREGSRDRTQVRVGVSGTDASVVVEGPLGHAKAGSWLVSARKSYLELLLKQIQGEGDDNFGFGFSDVQSKLVYDLSPRNHVELSLVAGRSRLDQTSTLNEVNTVDDGRNHAVLVNGAWRFTASPRFVITERLAVATQQFSNLNVTGVELGSGSAREITGRTDFVATATGSLTFEGGGQIQGAASRRDRPPARLEPRHSPLRHHFKRRRCPTVVRLCAGAMDERLAPHRRRGRAGRSLVAHQGHGGVAVGAGRSAAHRHLEAARRHRHLPPVSRLPGSHRAARQPRAQSGARVPRGCRHRADARLVGAVADDVLQPRGARRGAAAGLGAAPRQRTPRPASR